MTLRKNEKSTQPTDQSTLLREVLYDDDEFPPGYSDSRVEPSRPEPSAEEQNTDWTPFQPPPKTQKIIGDIEALVEQNSFVRKELQDLHDSLEEQRGKLE